MDIALELVSLVIAWYSERLAAEENAQTPDVARIAELDAAQEACAGDLERVRRAGPEELAQIVADYRERYRSLSGL
ncbi:hypothetical protein [Streptomyces sp. NBC_01546]|uniref:hypothetical protein n=1 Tax=Streptomyces sp. NBC_01546 TaxID=2975872 RepID=UPI002F90B10B